MAKKDYREKIEEDRQQIEVETELSRLSRSKHKAKKRKNPLISILLVTFILIPLSLLVYVKFFYEPKPSVTEEVESNNEQVEMQTNAKTDEPQDEQQEPEETEAEKQAAQEQAKKDAELAAAKKAEEEKKAEEAKKAAEQAAQAQSKSHTVQPGDTLYSIAMKYYGDPGAVEKIRVANGLSSDSIPSGKTLVLP